LFWFCVELAAEKKVIAATVVLASIIAVVVVIVAIAFLKLKKRQNKSRFALIQGSYRNRLIQLCDIDELGEALLAFHGRTLIVGILIGVILGVSFGYALTSLLGLAPLLEQINELRNNIGMLQVFINDTNSEMSVLYEQISSRETQISFLQSRISSLEQQLESSIGVLSVRFSPNGGCEDQVLYWIGRANVSIHVLIYSFTLDSIGDALVTAHNRGIEVQVVFEKGQISQYSEYQRLKDAGIAVRNDTNSHYMHDKIMIVDGIIVLTGSYNYSENAESYNNENLIVISSTFIAEAYEEEFAEIWNESQ
jgi:hypothetical protein